MLNEIEIILRMSTSTPVRREKRTNTRKINLGEGNSQLGNPVVTESVHLGLTNLARQIKELRTPIQVLNRVLNRQRIQTM